jgi:alcohol dehydrogenase
VGERRVLGSITGTPFECEQALEFSKLSGVRPMIERLPLERADEAHQRMRSGEARFRMVLTVAPFNLNPAVTLSPEALAGASAGR